MYDYTHIPGRAVLHRGRHRHGARATSSGLRINLLLWCRRYTGLSLQFIYFFDVMSYGRLSVPAHGTGPGLMRGSVLGQPWPASGAPSWFLLFIRLNL